MIKDFIHYYKPYKKIILTRFYLCGNRGHSRTCLSSNGEKCHR